MAPKSTKKLCYVCKRYYPTDECEKIGANYYCPECGKKHRADADAYRELIEYVCQLYGLKAPNMLILSQIKRFKEEEGFTYNGMRACLEYFFELQEHDVNASKGIGIIPYIYDEVKELYAQKKAAKQRIENSTWDGQGIVNIVTVEQYEDEEPCVELFDISKIGGDEDEE